jgi:hypothetical protein
MAKSPFQAVDRVEALMAQAEKIRRECDEARRAFASLEHELQAALGELAQEKRVLWDAAFDAVEDELRRTHAHS